MLKLVTQFDNPEMRPSVATPTCGPCCCCCCCCVVTTIATGVITSRNVAHAISAQQDKKAEVKPLKYKLISGFSLPLAIIGGIITGDLAGEFFWRYGMLTLILGFIAGIGIYSGLMTYLVKNTNLSKKVAIATIILSIIGIVIEFFVWLWLLV